MTIKSPTNLETMDYKVAYWVHIYNKNIDLLNSVLLKVNALGDVNPDNLQDGAILTWSADRSKWIPRLFRKKLGDGVPCFRDDDFNKSNDDPPNENKWRVTVGNPTIQSNQLRMRSQSAVTDTVLSKWSLTGDFDIFVFYDVTGTPATDKWRLELTFYIDATHYFSIGPAYNSGIIVEAEHAAGGSATTNSTSRTNDKGLIRLERKGSNLYGWYKDGNRQPHWAFLVRRLSVGAGDGKIQLRMQVGTGNPDATGYLENFRIARGCSGVDVGTSTTTTTTSTTTSTTTTV